MPSIELLEELHSNTRRTRITYRARCGDLDMALKCYSRPLWGVIHWLRAQRRGASIRRVGAPVPDIVFSGWLARLGCFAYGTRFLAGYEPLRTVLLDTPDAARQRQLLRKLGALVADLHQRGVAQGDGNLTNFLLGPEDHLMVVDEDDIKVFHGLLPLQKAIDNLANIAARLPDEVAAGELLASYLEASAEARQSEWQHPLFWQTVNTWRAILEGKRAGRNIEARRRFD